MKKVGKIKAVIKDNDELQTIEFESGRVDTVDTVKADNNKNVELTSYVEFDDFVPENHKGQYVILSNCDVNKGWDGKRITVIDELIHQISESYLGAPDYSKKHIEPKVNVALNGTNEIKWIADDNGYVICHLLSVFNESENETYNCSIIINNEVVYRHSERVGRTRYEMIQTLPVKKGDVIELIPSGNKEPDHFGRGIIYFVPSTRISKSMFDKYFDELNKLQFYFKYNGNDLFNITKWGVFNEDTFYGTTTFSSNLINNLTGDLYCEVFKNDEIYGRSEDKLITFSNDLYNNHSFVNDFEIKREVIFIGTTCFTLSLEFYKKLAGAGGDVTVEIKLTRHNIENENITDEIIEESEPVDPPIVYTEGLQYQLVNNEYCIVSGIGLASGDIIIPPTHEGLPITRIGSNAFYNCKSLTSIDLSNVTSIGYDAFRECSNLTSINMPNVTSIGDVAFYDCTSLTSINMPNVTTIGSYAFGDCTSLTSINLPNVTEIRSQAFYNCTSLTSIDLPNVTSLGIQVFGDCTSLTSVNIPNVTFIESGAFKNCTSITSISLPNVITMSTNVFYGWTSSQTIYVQWYGTKPQWWDYGWNSNCNAVIKYWNGTEYV
jgi:hypothetical protein